VRCGATFFRPRWAWAKGGCLRAASPPAGKIRNSFQNKFELILKYPAGWEMSTIPPRPREARAGESRVTPRSERAEKFSKII